MEFSVHGSAKVVRDDLARRVVDDDDGLLVVVVGVGGKEGGQQSVVVVTVGRVVVVARLFLLLLLLGRRRRRAGRCGHGQGKCGRRSQEQGDWDESDKKRTEIDSVESWSRMVRRRMVSHAVLVGPAIVPGG